MPPEGAIGQPDDLSRLAVMQALGAALDDILRRLPAVRDEASVLHGRLKAWEEKLGRDEVQRRLALLSAKDVEPSPLAGQAFRATRAFNLKWREYRLDDLAELGEDAGQAADMARRLLERAALLKRATVLLEELDRVRAAVALLDRAAANRAVGP
jgi:hypothetical protein